MEHLSLLFDRKKAKARAPLRYSAKKRRGGYRPIEEVPSYEEVDVETAGDNFVCQECEDISEAGPYELDEAEDLVPVHPWCLLPGALVEGSVIFALESRYAGPAIEIRTASGKRLRLTIKHPVLTRRGWIAAQELRQGDQLVSQRGDVGVAATPLVDKNQYDRPIAIEQIFNALRSCGVRFIKPTSNDLHGDARYVKREISIVAPDRRLLRRLDFSAAKHGAQRALELADVYHPVVASYGTFQQFGERSLPSFGSSMGRCGLPLALRLDHPGPFEEFSVGSSAHWQIAKPESAFKSTTAHAKFFRALLKRYASEIQLDEVVDVERFAYTGHVYDLQTATGYMIANGIVVSNCRCAFVPAGRGSARDAIMMVDARNTDPTKTNPIRVRMRSEGDRRWQTLRLTIRQALIENDLIGQRGVGRIPHGDKTEGFAAWLQAELNQKVFGVDGSWVRPYIRQAAIIAQAHATQHAPGGRVDQSRVASMETLAVSELRGITEAAQQQITRVVTQSLMANATPMATANAISGVIRGMCTRTRAMSEWMIAKTHATSTLSAFRDANVRRVGTIPERRRRQRSTWDFDPDEPRDPKGKWTSSGADKPERTIPAKYLGEDYEITENATPSTLRRQADEFQKEWARENEGVMPEYATHRYLEYRGSVWTVRSTDVLHGQLAESLGVRKEWDRHNRLMHTGFISEEDLPAIERHPGGLLGWVKERHENFTEGWKGEKFYIPEGHHPPTTGEPSKPAPVRRRSITAQFHGDEAILAQADALGFRTESVEAAKRFLGIEDFDPDEPRDPHGRWTFAGGPAGEHWQKVADDAIKEWQEENPKVLAKTVELSRDLDKVMREAAQFESFKDWYDEHRPLAKRLFGEDEPLFEKFVAAASIQGAGKVNINRAIDAYVHYKLGGSFEEGQYSGVMGVHREQFKKAAEGQELSGPKIVPFHKALTGDLDQVAIDRWMKRILFKHPYDKGGSPQVPAAVAVIKKMADKIGWKPAQLQAALWAVAMTRAGEKPFGFKKILEDNEARIRSIMHTVHAFADALMDALNLDLLSKLADAYRDARLLVTALDKLRGTTDYDPNEARDPRGRWTEAGTGGSYEFVSPSVRASRLFGSSIMGAARDIEGQRHRQLREASADIDRRLGIANQDQDAVGAWADGAEDTVISRSDADWDRLKLSAAMKGMLADQKSVLVFKEDEHGSGALYSFDVSGEKLDYLHDNLVKDGVAFHTLVPHGGGVTVYAADLDGSAANAVKKAADRYGSQVTARVGRAEFVGTTKEDGTDRQQRNDARKQYKAEIASSGVPGAAAIWTGVRDTWGKTFRALEAKSQELVAGTRRFEVLTNPSEKDLGSFVREHGIARVILDPENNLYVWPAHEAIHAEVQRLLDIREQDRDELTLQKGRLVSATRRPDFREARERAMEILGRVYPKSLIDALMDADWNEELHPRDPHGRFAFARTGEFGPRSLPSAEFIAHAKEVILKAVDPKLAYNIEFDTHTGITDDPDFGPSLIHGETNSGTNRIRFFIRNLQGLSDKQIGGIAKHESMHAKWNTVAKAPETKDQLTEFMTKDARKTMLKEMRDHPVSPYSDEHWQLAASGKSHLSVAVHETFAEMARREYEEGKLPKGIPTWTKFYNLVNSLWDKKHAASPVH